jgi:hypothetical protein
MDRFHLPLLPILQACVVLLTASTAVADDNRLIGHWILQGDTRDHSGHGNDAVNHCVDLQTGDFSGRGAYGLRPRVPVSRGRRRRCNYFAIDVQLQGALASHAGDMFPAVAQVAIERHGGARLSASLTATRIPTPD